VVVGWGGVFGGDGFGVFGGDGFGVFGGDGFGVFGGDGSGENCQGLKTLFGGDVVDGTLLLTLPLFLLLPLLTDKDGDRRDSGVLKKALDIDPVLAPDNPLGSDIALGVITGVLKNPSGMDTVARLDFLELLPEGAREGVREDATEGAGAGTGAGTGAGAGAEVRGASGLAGGRL